MQFPLNCKNSLEVLQSTDKLAWFLKISIASGLNTEWFIRPIIIRSDCYQINQGPVDKRKKQFSCRLQFIEILSRIFIQIVCLPKTSKYVCNNRK